MKKFLTAFGIAALLALLVFTGVNAFSRYTASQYEDTTVPYIEAVVPALSTWDEQVIKTHMAPEVLERTTEENFSQIVAYLSKMGELRTMEEPRFDQVKALPGTGGEKTVIFYKIDAVYENGDAEIALALLEEGDSFKVSQFNVSSLALGE